LLSFGSADSCDEGLTADGCVEGLVEDDCTGGLTGVTGDSKGLLGFRGAGDFGCVDGVVSLS